MPEQDWPPYKAVMKALRAARRSGDTEGAHSEADAALVEFLDALGYQAVTAVYAEVDKWYA